MIEIQNLSKRYYHSHYSQSEDHWVLKDINLTIPTGVSVGLVGANGAGKSTLLRLIAGMDTPQKGRVIRHSKVSWPIGLAAGLQSSMTGRQNVKFVARMHGTEYDINSIIERVQDFAEIGPAFDEPIRTYSSGMRSRLNFGLSLAFDFDVYLSDEATAVGDRSFKAKASKAFKDKVGQASLIMVSHGEGILKELCQAGIYLKEGRAYWYDSVHDAIKAYHADSDGPQLDKMTLQALQKLRKERRAVMEEAKLAREAAETLPPREKKPYGDALRAAREALREVREEIESRQASAAGKPGTLSDE
ncbi:ATP-binding cassette domain-containing protein [Cobetia sp. D5]|uniref:ABC transporter ATP-binding protein n=1 Tax=Cobetia sp. D5 TaxID=3105867 RepID=UPI002D790B3B|nr:ATP-binding cassette domain-containing protein [Cobetia sp. D5]